MLKKHETYFNYLQKGTDASMALFTWALSYWLRFEFFEGQQGLEIRFLRWGLISIVLTIYFFHKEGLYKSQRYPSRYKEIFAVLGANSKAVFALILCIYFFGDERISRLTLILYFFTSQFTLVATRLMIRNYLRYIRQKGKNLRHVLAIGNGPQLQRFLDNTKKYKDAGIKILETIPNPSESLSEIGSTIERLSPDAIVIGLGSDQENKLTPLLDQIYNTVIPIQVIPNIDEMILGHRTDEFAGQTILHVNQPKLSSLDLFAKRALDIFISGLGLIIISPLVLLVAIVTKLTDPGPIFFGQERVGMDGQSFLMWKFRTMKVAKNDEDKKEWGSKDNPRKTKFGSLLRQSSLDELPQLWNVFIGEMSIVGPRPERTFFVNQFKNEIPAYMLRHKMKAGITGWAQVNGLRGDTDLHTRIEYDLHYIKNWSIWLDLKIIFLTFWKGLINKNAY